MAKLVYALNVSLDGYVDHDRFAPDAVLFRHFIADIAGLSSVVYGRGMYELMRYWDQDDPAWDEDRRAYAAAWRGQRKWVVSRTLTDVGPNAILADDVEALARRLKAEAGDGVVEVAGPVLAGSLTRAGLIDEYRMYLHPVVLGHGRPFFVDEGPRLKLTGSERIGGDVIRLTYVPAQP